MAEKEPNERKRKRQEKKQRDSYLSWRQMFRLYRQIRIPWGLLILTLISTLAVKQAQVLLVPYQSKIMTGAITEYGFLGGFLAVTIISGVIEAVQGGINELGGVVTARNVRRTIWRKMLHLPMSYYDEEKSQSLVSRVTQDTTGAYAALTALVQMISVIYGLYTSFQKMFITYKSLALIMLSAIPITLLAAWIVGKMQYKIIYITNTAMARITNFFGERLPNVWHIKTSGTEDEEYRKGIKANDDLYKAEVRKEGIFIFMSPIGTLAQYINEIILLLVATALVRSGVMKMFQMVNLYNYFLLFMSNAFMISAVWQSVKLSHGSCTTIARIADAPSEDLEGGEPMEEGGDITFEHVSFSYGEGGKVLEDVSFVIPQGKVTALVGENGSGKSTIVKLLERFWEADSGTIRLGGRKLAEVNLAWWRESLGYLGQGDQMVKGSIAENIAYGLEREYTLEELSEAARLANAYEFIQEKEKGFDTQISRFDAKCSGGEMQRIAIARAILKEPRYLIMDEATSGIDVVSAAQVLDGLEHVMAGKTVIMVSHDMEQIKKADHIVVLGNGTVEASGSLEEVTQNSALFRSFMKNS